MHFGPRLRRRSCTSVRASGGDHALRSAPPAAIMHFGPLLRSPAPPDDRRFAAEQFTDGPLQGQRRSQHLALADGEQAPVALALDPVPAPPVVRTLCRRRVELLAVVLDRDALLVPAEVEQGQVTPWRDDRDLCPWPREAGVDHPQPEPCLTLRLRQRLDQ